MEGFEQEGVGQPGFANDCGADPDDIFGAVDEIEGGELLVLASVDSFLKMERVRIEGPEFRQTGGANTVGDSALPFIADFLAEEIEEELAVGGVVFLGALKGIVEDIADFTKVERIELLMEILCVRSIEQH